MARTLAEKLQIKPETELVFGPSTPEQRDMLAPLPEGVTVVDGIDRDTIGVAVMFAHNREELDALLTEVLPLLASPKAIWIGYPKATRPTSTATASGSGPKTSAGRSTATSRSPTRGPRSG